MSIAMIVHFTTILKNKISKNMKTEILLILIGFLIIGNSYCFGKKPVKKSELENFNLKLIQTYKENIYKKILKPEL